MWGTGNVHDTYNSILVNDSHSSFNTVKTASVDSEEIFGQPRIVVYYGCGNIIVAVFGGRGANVSDSSTLYCASWLFRFRTSFCNCALLAWRLSLIDLRWKYPVTCDAPLYRPPDMTLAEVRYTDCWYLFPSTSSITLIST